MNTKDFISGILNGDRTTLSRAITLVESNLEKHQKQADEIISHCIQNSGNSIRVGITGVPGVGKSTFIEAIGKYLTSKGKKVAVLAIDPTSEKTGGSILGDKTRMNQLSIDELAFIRPSPTAGSLGGVAKKTRETIILCEAAGYEIILIETVGVGQSETLVHSMVDFFLLLMLSGAGDELQGIKRGIMEMADAILINKADGDNFLKAKKAKQQYKSALHLFPPTQSGWIPKVELCSAIENKNIDYAWETIENHKSFMIKRGLFENKRKEQNLYWFHQMVKDKLLSKFYTENSESLKQIEKELEKGKITPSIAMEKLF
ncbi:MAG: methylmalonyl Co-A mutase-associated GTPase MeaB [Flavobacteriales bacterium]